LISRREKKKGAVVFNDGEEGGLLVQKRGGEHPLEVLFTIKGEVSG